MSRSVIVSLVLAVASLLVLAPECTLGAGDFGLPYTVPGFDASFRSNIGAGVVGIVKANASLSKYDVTLDRSGVTVVLYGMANNLTTPLNRLLGHVAASFGANSTNAVSSLFDDIQTLKEPTEAALGVAKEAILSLEGKLGANAIESMAANVTTIATEVATLLQNLPVLGEAVSKAGQPDSTYDATNIATLITSDLAQSLIAPIGLINAGLNDIATVYGAIGKERSTAIGHEMATNTSVQSSQLDLANHFTVFARSVADAVRQMEQQSNDTARQVREEYNRLQNRLIVPSENEGAMKKFTDAITAQGLEHNRLIKEQLNELANNYTTTLQTVADALAMELRNATARFVDEAALAGATASSERCLQRSVADFRKTEYGLSRFSSCNQADGRTFNFLTTISRSYFELLRYSSIYANQASTVCAQGSTNCSAVYLGALEELQTQNGIRLDSFESLLRVELAALSQRYDICARAIRADIDHHIQTTQDKFSKCLVTGR
ncbi:uncharacterized protein LOC118461941 [Anopheles albimanus]|uniref:Uncharacterized protein n=1 Tax=Anopheles albimanus TaxID=7167 RepID=A0A182F4X2_ANOAL|nr:uncharacterized protein LOC118461941 [Anopheles albimanus]